MTNHPYKVSAIDVLAIIPALNEEETIAAVIEGLRGQGITDICVVDNGSSDRTPEIATKHGAYVISEPRRGYGQACWSGLQSEMANCAEWILFCDADGSDDLSELSGLLALRTDYDFILGNRRGTLGGRSHLTPVQNFGNGLATTLLRYGWEFAYQDLGPVRLIRKQAIDQLVMTDRGYGWTIEMQVKAVEQGLRICERPVNYRPRQGGQSKIAGTVQGSIKAGQVILTTLGRLYWRKTGGAFCQRSWQKISSVVQTVAVQRGLLWTIALLITIGSLLAMPYGDFLNQPAAVPNFWRGTSLMSLGFVASWGLKKVSFFWFWAIALLPRLILLAMYPGDDIWRYLWEGHIQTMGHNPYLIAPSAEILMPLRFEWWSQINHPDLAAIYPPVTQLGFRLLAAISPSVLLFKSAFVAADVGICWLLSRRFGYLSTLLYAWNPLVIYSFAGGGHYDSWFLLPLVAAWLWWDSADESLNGWDAAARKKLASAIGIGLSIAVKWMSLPVLGFVMWQRRRQWRQVVSLLAIGVLPMAIATIPFCQGLSCPVIPLQSPFVNYGRSAAFIPQMVGSLLPNTIQANWIYALPLGGIIAWNFTRSASVGQFTERYFIALMLLSPIIHAWYFTWLVPFAVASRNWGTRLVSLSAFVYFALPHGLALGAESWTLSLWQRWLLWGPFILGLAISARPSVQSASSD